MSLAAITSLIAHSSLPEVIWDALTTAEGWAFIWQIMPLWLKAVIGVSVSSAVVWKIVRIVNRKDAKRPPDVP